jgi:hypothetical protein
VTVKASPLSQHSSVEDELTASIDEKLREKHLAALVVVPAEDVSPVNSTSPPTEGEADAADAGA